MERNLQTTATPTGSHQRGLEEAGRSEAHKNLTLKNGRESRRGLGVVNTICEHLQGQEGRGAGWQDGARQAGPRSSRRVLCPKGVSAQNLPKWSASQVTGGPTKAMGKNRFGKSTQTYVIIKIDFAYEHPNFVTQTCTVRSTKKENMKVRMLLVCQGREKTVARKISEK